MLVFGKDKLLDFTYIDDTVNGILLGIKNFKKAKNEVYNIASGKGITLLKVAQLLKKQLNSNSKIIIKQNRTGEVVKFVADINKAGKKFGYNPETNISKGLKKSIKWYNANHLWN